MNYKQMLDKFQELEQRIASLEAQDLKFMEFFENTPNANTLCKYCGLGSSGVSNCARGDNCFYKTISL